MKPSLFLRIAAIAAFLYFAGHMAGAPWTPVKGPGESVATSFRVCNSRRYAAGERDTRTSLPG